MSGNRIFPVRSALLSHKRHMTISPILAATRITVFTAIKCTDITVTATQLNRFLARLIEGGISLCGDVV
jgi:hypothetical protein